MGKGVTNSVHILEAVLLGYVVSQMKPKQPPLSVSYNQTQHRLLSLDYACGTESNMCAGWLNLCVGWLNWCSPWDNIVGTGWL